MRILYIAMEHDYGKPERGPSFEEMSFRSALVGMGHDVHPFDFHARMLAAGRDGMRKELIDAAGDLRPDLAFFFLFESEIDPKTISRVGSAGRCPTMNWFADDHWRFEDFTRRFAPVLDWSITTDRNSLPRYAALGVSSVLLSQWGVNRYAYGRTAERVDRGITFVGLPHGDRPKIIADLEKEGHVVECWGKGWPNGRLSHENMVRLFGSSAINLNLSNSSTAPRTLRFRVGALIRGRWPDALRARPRPSQLKGRTFEVPGSGGFLLTERVPYLDEYFVPGKEVGVFDGPDDLSRQLRYWLDRPRERSAVADAGYRKAMAEHTYDRRFELIFQAAGLV